MNQKKLGIFLSYINIILQAGIGFIYVPLLLSYMGNEEYGLYQLIGSIIAYFSIMDFGLTSSTIQGYVKYKKEDSKKILINFLGMVKRIYFLLSFMIIILGGIFYNFLEVVFRNKLEGYLISSAKFIFILLIFNLVVTFMGFIYRSIIMANERFIFLKVSDVLQLILQPILVIIGMRIEPTAVMMVIIITICNIVLFFIRKFYCYKILRVTIEYYFWDRRIFKEMKKLSLSIFIVGLADMFFWKTNQIVLGFTSGLESVTIYAIASLVFLNYMTLGTIVPSIYLPKITRLVIDKVDNSILFNEFLRIGRWQYLLLFWVTSGFILFGKDFIILWCGINYIDAYYIILLIILPFTIDLIQTVASVIMRAKNIYDFRAKVYIIIGVLNIILSIILSSNYGVIGAGIACDISIIISNIIMNIFYKKVLLLDLGLFWENILRMSFIGSVCICGGVILNLLFDNTIYFFIFKIIMYTILFAIIMWSFSLNKEEKLLVKRIIKRGIK